jgi:hypothetical protein
MDEMNPEVRATFAPWYDGVEMLIREKRNDGTLAVGTSVIMESKLAGSFVQPTFRLSNTAAQVLMDDLWNAGLRPTEGAGSAGSLRATEKHLNDMRRIVGKQLGIELADRLK